MRRRRTPPTASVAWQRLRSSAPLLVCGLFLGSLLLACAQDDASAPGDALGEGPPPALQVLVQPVTVWGTPLEGWRVVGPDGEAGSPATGLPVVSMEVGDEVSLTVSGSEDFVPASVRLSRSEEGALHAAVEEGSGYGAAAIAAPPRAEERRYLFVGLDHRWFAASGRAASGQSDVRFHMDGEEFWGAVSDELPQAREEVLLGTWWWQSHFELRRAAEEDHWHQGPAERRPQTILGLLEALPAAVDRRVLVAWFSGNTAEGFAYLNTDPELREHARTDADGIEAMVQANPTEVPLFERYPVPPVSVPLAQRLAALPAYSDLAFEGLATAGQALSSVDAASYHQKFLVIDRQLGFVSGMNVKSTDWDSSEHRVFDARRMKFDSSLEERLAVLEGRALPDLGPRKDYGVTLRGPAVAALVDIYCQRWAEARRSGAVFSEYASPLDCETSSPAPAGDLWAQVQATLPAPFDEASILESHIKAVRQAQDYIYIEDQYFRAPLLNEHIAWSMEQHPDLRLVVVTKPVSITDGGKKYTYEADETFRSAFGDRYLLLQLQSFVLEQEGYESEPGDLPPHQVLFQPIDVHSKIMIVDDRYLSVGSANKNNRGYLYEGELNVSVLDAAFVHEARRRVMANLLGPGGEEVAASPYAQVFEALRERAEDNRRVEAFWGQYGDSPRASLVEAHSDQVPRGFVFPLTVSPTYLMDVGPDTF